MEEVETGACNSIGTPAEVAVLSCQASKCEARTKSETKQQIFHFGHLAGLCVGYLVKRGANQSKVKSSGHLGQNTSTHFTSQSVFPNMEPTTRPLVLITAYSYFHTV